MASLGFTGTQKGMTRAQVRAFRLLVRQLQPDEFHHGDCVGADEQAEGIVRQVASAKLYVHPGPDMKRRAHCLGDMIYDPKPFLERNQDIVDASDQLIATPKESEENLRSGTWSTIRRARKAGIPVTVIWPDGSVG